MTLSAEVTAIFTRRRLPGLRRLLLLALRSLHCGSLGLAADRPRGRLDQHWLCVGVDLVCYPLLPPLLGLLVVVVVSLLIVLFLQCQILPEGFLEDPVDIGHCLLLGGEYLSGLFVDALLALEPAHAGDQVVPVLMSKQSVRNQFLPRPAPLVNVGPSEDGGLVRAGRPEVVLVVDVPVDVREVGRVVGHGALEAAPGDGLDGHVVDLSESTRTVESTMPMS